VTTFGRWEESGRRARLKRYASVSITSAYLHVTVACGREGEKFDLDGMPSMAMHVEMIYSP
jgi:hypothetical protein